MKAKRIYGGPWPRIRLIVLERDGYVCQIKGPRCKGKATQADHIIPVVEGGPWYDLTNLRASCGVCNPGRTTRRQHALSKLALRKPLDPGTPSRVW